jgi:hypothetical protein
MKDEKFSIYSKKENILVRNILAGYYLGLDAFKVGWNFVAVIYVALLLMARA